MLSGLILGESLLNDAVAIVLCSAIEEYSRLSLANGDVMDIEALLLTILKFFTVFIGSVGLGGGNLILNLFLAASTECSAGSNNHFVVGVGVPSLVQFDGRPLGGANFQY
jgi:NhaP-type Na+/H+ or K+/H+ antiporter